MFKAIEVDAASRQRTGRDLALDADSRQAAIDLLLAELKVPPESAHVDPSRTVVRVGEHLWTVVRASVKPETAADPSLRRGGAKHKQVR
ncbi:MAG: hypothetical protein JO020_22815 [Chloroflexi bacterium]|nr:hypothetical protein [Chloroflexota bacterium]